MHKVIKEKYNLEFVDFCLRNGVSEHSILNRDNIDKYSETAADAYNGYPLFEFTFKGKYKEKIFGEMLKVDLKSKIGNIFGIASDKYESVLLIEPPLTGQVKFIQYLRVLDLHSFPILFFPATARQSSFEKYAYRMRKKYLDDRTWYIYLFTTKKKFQRQGYGKKLLELTTQFANKFNYNLCLETNLKDNIKMYTSFGFKHVSTSLYKNKLEHFVMFYKGNKDS